MGKLIGRFGGSMELTNINDIVAFVTVVECGSYTLAAKKLGLTRSAVGKRIVRLEERLATRLFQRTTRKLNLTDDGEILYARSSQTLQDLEETEVAMAKRAGEPRGLLAFSLPMTLGRRHVLPVIEQYLQLWPEVTATVAFTDRFVDLIEEGIDVAIRTGPLRHDSSLLTRTVARQHMLVCAAPDYLARKGAPERPQQLVEHDCLCFLTDGRARPWTFNIDGQNWQYTGTARMLMNDGEALQAAALAGFGIAHLPNYLIDEDLRAGRLVPLLEAFALGSEPVQVIYPSKRHLSPKIRCFIDLIAECWRDTPPWERALGQVDIQ
jgi:DNA-binding transcriptional LysR family regulator